MDTWKKDLDDFFNKKKRIQEERQKSALEKFIGEIVRPAFDDLREELQRHDRSVNTRISPSSAQLIVQFSGADEFTYRIQGRNLPERIVPYAEIVCKERKGVRLVKHESMLRTGQDYGLDDVTKDEIIRHFLTNYMSRTEA